MAKGAGKPAKPRPVRRPREDWLGWQRRRLAWWLSRRAGSPFELLAERRHPLVRAELRRTRRGRRIAAAVCAAIPLLLFLLALVTFPNRYVRDDDMGGYDLWPSLMGLPIGLFVCFWPLVMYLGAAWSAAGAVTEEIDGDTALQLTLTPIPARPLAAAKILPRVRPYLWGILAALPLYMWVGGSEPFIIGIAPTPLVLWPLRSFAPLWAMNWRLEASGAGVLGIGPLMCLTDLSLVWAAALWGAAFAIRERSLLRVALRLAVQIFLTAIVVGLCLLGGLVLGLLPLSCVTIFGEVGEGVVLVAGLSLAVLAGGAFFAFLWWQTLLRRPADEVLTAFQAFDRLANEEFRLVALPWREQPARGQLVTWRPETGSEGPREAGRESK